MHEIIIVNNDIMLVENPFTHLKLPIRWVNVNYNAGFGRANNLGAKMASGDILLFLNPDIIFLQSMLNFFKAQFSQAPNLVACSPQLLQEDKSPQVTGFYNLPFGFNIVRQIPYIGALFGALNRLTGAVKANEINVQLQSEFDWITGACLFVRSTSFNAVNGFDEDFFLYAEETELCSRLKKLGKLIVFGNINILHLEGGTFATKDVVNDFMAGTRGKQIMLSSFVRLKKEFSLFNSLVLYLIYLITLPLVLLVASLHTLLSFKLRYLKNALSYGSNVLNTLRYIPKLINGKKYLYKTI